MSNKRPCKKQRGHQLVRKVVADLIKENEELELRLKNSQKAADEVLSRAKVENNRLKGAVKEIFESIDVLETYYQIPEYFRDLYFPFELHMSDEPTETELRNMDIARRLKEAAMIEILQHLKQEEYISWSPVTAPIIKHCLLREGGGVTSQTYVIKPENYIKIRRWIANE